jgi:uncharacterized protein YbaA (DUF1428 family)
MAHYIDGFVISLPKKNVNAYRRMAQKARCGGTTAHSNFVNVLVTI